MKQTNHKLPEPMIARLKAESKRTGAPQSEIIRRALDAYLKRREPKRRCEEATTCGQTGS